jgi:hypothetical protein
MDRNTHEGLASVIDFLIIIPERNSVSYDRVNARQDESALDGHSLLECDDRASSVRRT